MGTLMVKAFWALFPSPLQHGVILPLLSTEQKKPDGMTYLFNLF